MKVLLADGMVRAADLPLEARPYSFDPVRRHVAAHILALGMTHRLVASVLAPNGRVGAALVRHQVGTRVYEISEVPAERRAGEIRNNAELYLAAARRCAHHRGLALAEVVSGTTTS